MLVDPAGLKVTVMGLGLFGGGVGAARYFARRGAKVTVTDLKDRKTLLPSIKELSGLDITFHLGGHRGDDFSQSDLVVASPGVRRDSPYLEIVRRAGSLVTSEMNVFLALCRCRVIGITGSNGKSTTTSLIEHLLSSQGVSTHMGGGTSGCPCLIVWRK